MKKSFGKQNLVLLVAGLIVSGLMTFQIVSRNRYEAQLAETGRLKTASTDAITAAEKKYREAVPGSDIASPDAGIIPSLQQARSCLQNLYDGKQLPPSVLFDRGAAEMLAIKIALIEIEHTTDAINAKSAAIDFTRAIAETNRLVDLANARNRSQHAVIEISQWLSVFLAVLIFGAITFWNYIGDRKFMNQTLKTEGALIRETGRVKMLSGFIEAMATGNYSIELKADKGDELGATLVTMRDKLKINAEEDQRRNWATAGLAQIGEILRASNKSSVDLFDSIIKFVVKYSQSNQGGLFVINDEQAGTAALDLVACYAFERKKFITRQIHAGQGLVGQCFLERETIHLREIPQDYVRITSGLGGENPKSCLLVPLKINDAIYGVIELASFHMYREFEIELVEKLAETIASTISAVRTNESTRELLERTQQQAEEMKSQEEEMRQNMEELSATQEEMQRKEQEYLLRIRELEEQLNVGVN